MKLKDFKLKKANNEKISLITCYDYCFAEIINDTDVDCVLVGDSGSMVMHGCPTTVHATTEMMAGMVSAVVKGASDKFIIGDMPFLSYRCGLEKTMDCVDRLMKAGANAIKLEGVEGNHKLIKHIIESGVPIVGHIGLTPQSVNGFGGYVVQGRDQKNAERLLQEIKKLEELGCIAAVLECVPSELSKNMSEAVSIPTIGIGAGANTDGQVLVLQDMLGMNKNSKMKFLRKYLNLYDEVKSAINKYSRDVKEITFPNENESF
ncbi:MAG TPA: 3-methyl-2-oxobutanoate hydroxymethyltransferase [Victivallales bacterium]|nr:3-methyl-2-oxobutanoate hydroxymethyltransferase [Victivallales bacterium]